MAIKTLTFNYTGNVQSFTAPVNGIYSLKAYGASGGNSARYTSQRGGNGGYASGDIKLLAGQTIYIHVGGQGGDPNAPDSISDGGGYNGGGSLIGGQSAYGAPGGGATDFRTSPGAWDNLTGLQSRVLVAGGGGGANSRDDGYGYGSGGDGGGLVGTDGTTGGQNSGGMSYGYGYGTGGTQTSGGSYRWYQNGTLKSDGISGGFGVGGTNSQSGGGGGWYGGGCGGHGGGGGGSSYCCGSLLNPTTIAGVNNGNGKAIITYEDYEMFYLLKKDGEYYIPQKAFFDIHNKKFNSVTIEYILNNYTITNPDDLNKPFVMNGKTFYPSDILDFSNCQICAFTQASLDDKELKMLYEPSNISLAKTTVRVKDKFTPFSSNLDHTFLNIISPDKNKLDYFIDYNRDDQDNLRKSCGILNKEILKYDFFLSFKFDAADAKLQIITLFGRNDKYTKIKDYSIDVYDDFISKAYIVFHKDYDEVFVNKISSERATYTINTLDKF